MFGNPNPTKPARPLSSLFDRKAVAFFAAYYRQHWGKLLLFTVIASAQSLVFVPMLMLIRSAFDEAIPQGDVRKLVFIGVGVFLLRLLWSAITLFQRSSILKTMKRAVTELREDLIARMYVLSSGHFARSDLDRLQTRLVQDSERVDVMSNGLLSVMLPAFFTSIVLLAYLIVLDWQLVLITIAAVPLSWIGARVSGWIVKRDVRTFQRAFEGFSKGVLFTLRHLDLTRSKAYEKEAVARQHALIDELRTSGHRMAMSFAWHRQVQRTISGFVGIIILVVGGAAVARGRMTLGEFLSFSFAAGLLSGQLDSLIGGVPDVIAGNESLLTLSNIMTDGEPEPYQGVGKAELDGSVEVRGATFAYGEQVVLRDLHLVLPRGRRIAIVGPNGSGKSTLLNLIVGFARPQRGELRAGGVPYDILDMRELRRSIGAVFQHPSFFAGTVLENIAYGCPDATRDDAVEAARMALADDFIAQLPQGYDTQIGEGGVLLSGGECQRLAIARALLGKPKLLILDEPTNHLDRDAIERLMSALIEWPARPTLVIISHDPTVIEFADTVYRLEHGALVGPRSGSSRAVGAGRDE